MHSKLNKCSVDLPESGEHDLIRLKSSFTFKNRQTSLESLVDSGSTHSFLNLNYLPTDVQNEIQNFIHQTNNKSNELGLKLKHVYVETFNSKFQTTCVEAMVNFSIGDYIGSHSFIISDQLRKEQSILGIDFIKNHNVWLTGRDFVIKGSISASTVIDCKAAKSIIIPANSEKIITTTTSSLISINKVHVFEAHDLSSKGLIFAKSINQSAGKDIKVLAMNYTNQDVVIQENEIIGTLSEVEEVLDLDQEKYKDIPKPSGNFGKFDVT